MLVTKHTHSNTQSYTQSYTHTTHNNIESKALTVVPSLADFLGNTEANRTKLFYLRNENFFNKICRFILKAFFLMFQTLKLNSENWEMKKNIVW